MQLIITLIKRLWCTNASQHASRVRRYTAVIYGVVEVMSSTNGRRLLANLKFSQFLN